MSSLIPSAMRERSRVPESITPYNGLRSFSQLVGGQAKLPSTHPMSFMSARYLPRNAVSNTLSPLLVSQHLFHNRQALAGSLRAYSNAAPPSTGTVPQPSSSMPKARPTFGQYPFRYIMAFAAIHPTFTWACVAPVYFLCHYTNLTTLLLAGPQGVALLHTRIPSYIPEGFLYGLRETRDKHRTQFDTGDPTLEEWMEMAIRKSARWTWTSAKKVRNAVGTVKSAVAGSDGDGWTPKADLETAKRIQKAAMNLQEGGLEGLKGKEAEKKPWYRKYAQSQVEDIKFKQVADGVAAWIIVKMLLPIRVPISLWLTPKAVARWV